MTASAITTIALSAIGSIIRPKLVSCFQARASLPSTKSVSAARMKRKKAIQSA